MQYRAERVGASPGRDVGNIVERPRATILPRRYFKVRKQKHDSNQQHYENARQNWHEAREKARYAKQGRLGARETARTGTSIFIGKLRLMQPVFRETDAVGNSTHLSSHANLKPKNHRGKNTCDAPAG